jgi:nucleotide-binding universal stress UspA family protein
MDRIVVGVDGSPAATAAARWAACEAAMRNVELTIVHVLQSAAEVWLQTGWPAIPLPAEAGEDQLAQGQKILEDTLSVIAKTTGRRQPRSISTRVCIGPVAVVHHHVSPVPPSGAPVVVGIDGSAASKSATAIAFDEAFRRAVELIAVHATDHADPTEPEELLAHWWAEYQQRYPNVTVRPVVVGAHPADALLDQSQQAQLLVVGSRGRGGLAGKMLGSVSAAVVQACRIPVIVAGRARPPTPSARAHVAPETCPMTGNAGLSCVVGVAQSRTSSTEKFVQPGGSDVH